MELTDFEVLEYLHDAVVTTLVYRLDADNRREFALTVVCHPDAGYPKWDGKRIVIRLHDLILANHFVFGAVTGREQIDSWHSQLSPSMAAELQRLAASGSRASGYPFLVTFHSGSVLEGICRHILVEVDEPA
jgi:hypothetical protein